MILSNEMRHFCKLTAVLGVVLISVSGCQSRSNSYDNRAWQSGRSASPASSNVRAEQEAGDALAAADHAKFYQLILFTVRAPGEAPDGIRYSVISKASAKRVGEMLTVLYMPSGASGVAERWALIYPTRTEWETAGSWARAMDIAPITAANAVMPEDTAKYFEFGIGLLYGTVPGDPEERDRLRLVVSALDSAGQHLTAPRPQRWAAGLIAGNLLMNRFFDYAAAIERYEQAEAVTPPGSLEQLMTYYQRAQAHIQLGEPDAAKSLLSQSLSEFDAFRNSEVFLRARRVLSELELGG